MASAGPAPHRSLFLVTVLSLVVALFAGCLGTPAGELADAADGPAGEAEDRAERVIEHDLGETTIVGTPKRVVALEWNFVEHLLAIGMQPVGMADKQGYKEWVHLPVALDDSVEDVGTRQEPSLEKILALEPDLILAIKFRHEGIYDRLSKIAPTLVYTAFPEEGAERGQFATMEHTLRQVGKAVNRTADADGALKDMRDHFKEVKQGIADADADGREILLTQVFTYQGAPVLRVFTDNALVIEVARRIGLENAWPEGHQQYGYSTVSMEALATVQHADFFYVAQPDDDPVEDQWSTNPVWNSYQFVREDRVYPLGAETWLFPGPLGAQVVADNIAAHYG